MTHDRDSWTPQLFEASDPERREELSRLLADDPDLAVHDTIVDQIADLLETRTPGLKVPGPERPAAARDHAGTDNLAEYGIWAHYPWRRAVTHLLPEAAFRELRTSRNRNKITAEEQERLRGLKLAIAGLSVGRATAVTLAMEEVGGEFRLADFDALDLSNLNRLRGSVLELGINKAVLTARELFEINPFLRIRIFAEGINDENLDAFLGEGGNIDMLFEECDDLAMKVQLRQRARELRIPVLMETSDRGMLDIERFDLEPERPLFHGLAGDLDHRALRGLSTYDKVPTVLKIIGAQTMSTRMTASLLDVDSTLKTWPQLASAVALGGAINADAARRIALDQHHGSGRYYIDIDRATEHPHEGPPPEEATSWSQMPQLELPEIPGPHAPFDERVEALVGHAVLAPSGGNMQPWSFVLRGGTLACFVDVERGAKRSQLDFESRASRFACGAACMNIELSAAAMGLDARIRVPEVQPPLDAPVFSVELAELEPPVPADPVLFEGVRARCTNRKLSPRVPLPEDHTRRLLDIAGCFGMRLVVLDDDEARRRVGELVAAGDRVRYLDPALHRELFSELRFSAREAMDGRDGIDLPSLELDATGRAGMPLTRMEHVMTELAKLGAGQGLGRPSRKAMDAASAAALLLVPNDEPTPYFTGGRVLQRIWIEATRLCVAMQPMTALLYMLHRLVDAPSTLSDFAREELERLLPVYRELFGVGAGERGVMLFRVFADAEAPSTRSLRRPVGEVLSVVEDTTARRHG